MIQQILLKIKTIREEKGLSLQEVADGIGYKTGKGYYDVESGRVALKVEHIERLADFYGIGLVYFFK